MKIRFALAALGVALAGPAMAQVADSSFETQGSGVGDYCYFNYTPIPCTATTPWNGGATTAQGGAGLQNEGNTAWPGTPTAFGSSYAFVQGNGTLFQVFTVAQAGSYVLSWLDAGRNRAEPNSGNQTYSVTINALSLGSFSTTQGQPFTARSSGVFDLLANTPYLLRFSGQATSDQAAFIDNVILSAAPEPGTWAMMITGFGIAGVALRRRRAPAKRAIA